jgi:hypothetical protein
LPDGLLLRYARRDSLYFFLRTWVDSGKILTRAFASDSPYDREETAIGEVLRPMFDPSVKAGRAAARRAGGP